jgi:hypothetical protein
MEETVLKMWKNELKRSKIGLFDAKNGEIGAKLTWNRWENERNRVFLTVKKMGKLVEKWVKNGPISDIFISNFTDFYIKLHRF